jgi:hypothetical protein
MVEPVKSQCGGRCLRKGQTLSEEVKPYLSEIRYHIDHLEMIVDNENMALTKIPGIAFCTIKNLLKQAILR